MALGKHSTVIFGCGNVIMGDDGLPAVIEELEMHCILPDKVYCHRCGTGIREYLFDYVFAPNLGRRE